MDDTDSQSRTAVAPLEPRLVSVNQAAEALGIGRDLAYRLIAKGVLASIKVGKRRLVPVQALDELVADLSQLT